MKHCGTVRYLQLSAGFSVPSTMQILESEVIQRSYREEELRDISMDAVNRNPQSHSFLGTLTKIYATRSTVSSSKRVEQT